MNEHRKKIILSEIKYWKQNNLLPGRYCDFLTTLYAQGDEQHKEEGNITSSILHKEKKKQKLSVLFILFIGILLAMVMLFIDNKFALLFGAIGIIILLSFATFKSSKQSIILPTIYIVIALLLLLMSLKLWSVFFSQQPIILISLLIFNCVIWLFAGRLLKLLYFTLSGAIGLICIIAYLVF
ncbi:hypothetical protein [Sporosarcina ureilytica]|nr:hypothetical protein [Sporosarcina ureilytica]